ncbi:MAG: MTH1187 family thiamine-binding protein [Acidobacteriota bacterium]
MSRVIVEVSFVPLGAGVSLSAYVAEAVRLIRESGLPHEFHSMGTNIEGEWEEVMGLVRRCMDRLFEMGAPRLTTSIKVSERHDKPYTMAAKVEAVETILAGR